MLYNMFYRKTILMASQAANGGKHQNIENSLSTIYTKKVFTFYIIQKVIKFQISSSHTNKMRIKKHY